MNIEKINKMEEIIDRLEEVMNELDVNINDIVDAIEFYNNLPFVLGNEEKEIKEAMNNKEEILRKINNGEFPF